jgi:hypothetical protein
LSASHIFRHVGVLLLVSMGQTSLTGNPGSPLGLLTRSFRANILMTKQPSNPLNPCMNPESTAPRSSIRRPSILYYSYGRRDQRGARSQQVSNNN